MTSSKILFIMFILVFILVYSPKKNEIFVYKKMTEFTITSYTPFECNDQWEGMVVHGKTMKFYTTQGINVAAVDPEIIPLKSWFKWRGILFYACDIGGKIKGKRIDILCPVYSNKKLSYLFSNFLGKRKNQTIYIRYYYD